MCGAGLQAFLVTNLHAAAGSRALRINAAGHTGSNLALQMHAAHRLLLGATKTELPRTDLRQRRDIKAALLRFLPVEGHTIVGAACTAALADGRISGHGVIN